MHKPLIGMLTALAFAGAMSAQGRLSPLTFGDGSDGVFAPTANMTIDTDTQACWQFTSVRIPAGVVVTVTGSKPLYIKSTGTVGIAGDLVSNGAAGVNSGNNTVGGDGGAGGAGGGDGGSGGANGNFNGTGDDGAGPRPGTGGVDSGIPGGPFTDPVGGGGGGGNASAGSDGGLPNAGGTTASGTGGVAGPGRGGSGGGGGGADIDSATSAGSNDGGGGGGGGGGWITIAAPTVIIDGSISVNGGDGGTSSGNGGGGGGGAGGCIDIVSPLITNNGSLSAVGGAAGGATQSNCGCSPGGAGGDGCINTYGGAITGSGTATPAVTANPAAILVNEACCIDIQIQLTGSATGYLSGVGVIPQPTNTPWGVACTLDQVFLTTLFPNSLPPVLLNSNGNSTSGTISICHPTGLGLTIADVTVIHQGVTVDGANNITGLTNCLDILIKI